MVYTSLYLYNGVVASHAVAVHIYPVQQNVKRERVHHFNFSLNHAVFAVLKLRQPDQGRGLVPAERAESLTSHTSFYF